MLLALFCVGTVHAASMGIGMQFSAGQDTTMAHCHDMGGDDMDHGDGHAKPHHGNLCSTCSACVPMLVGLFATLPVSTAAPALNPHREASYPAFVGRLQHRPPISA